jgi:hypothetical protein
MLALVVLLAAACQPKIPTEAEARAAFNDRRAALTSMEDTTFSIMGMAGPEHINDDTVRAIADVGGALGLRITGLGHAPPCIGGEANDNVAPASGFVDGRYRVGWGLYQTAWEQAGVKRGDGELHPGIVVTWKLGNGLKNEVTACFLLDGTPPPR